MLVGNAEQAVKFTLLGYQWIEGPLFYDPVVFHHKDLITPPKGFFGAVVGDDNGGQVLFLCQGLVDLPGGAVI